MDTLAVIPARKGSRRIKGKNTKLLCGKPLVCYTIEAALACAELERIVISTDIDEMPAIAAAYGSDRLTVMERSARLAADETSTEEVLLDVLARTEGAENLRAVVTLLPTSPFRGTAIIERCLACFAERNPDAVLTISRQKMKIGDFDEETGAFTLADRNTPAHMHLLRPVFSDNPSTYVTRPSVLREREFVLGDRNFGIEIDKISGLDVNDMVDWTLAEALIETGLSVSAFAGGIGSGG